MKSYDNNKTEGRKWVIILATENIPLCLDGFFPTDTLSFDHYPARSGRGIFHRLYHSNLLSCQRVYPTPYSKSFSQVSRKFISP